VAAFRAATAGSGAIAWQRDYEQLEEDWVHALLAPPPAERGISVHGARVVAGQMRVSGDTTNWTPDDMRNWTLI
jgi:hypothetical protein